MITAAEPRRGRRRPCADNALYCLGFHTGLARSFAATGFREPSSKGAQCTDFLSRVQDQVVANRPQPRRPDQRLQGSRSINPQAEQPAHQVSSANRGDPRHFTQPPLIQGSSRTELLSETATGIMSAFMQDVETTFNDFAVAGSVSQSWFEPNSWLIYF